MRGRGVAARQAAGAIEACSGEFIVLFEVRHVFWAIPENPARSVGDWRGIADGWRVQNEAGEEEGAALADVLEFYSDGASEWWKKSGFRRGKGKACGSGKAPKEEAGGGSHPSVTSSLLQ